jgi:hypothetical protein
MSDSENELDKSLDKSFQNFEGDKGQRDRHASVRLSVMNPDLAKKLRKFDTSNDGSIELSEALQAIVTLQKQSNNYKKMIWMFVPVILALIGCMFGVSLLAIKLTKDTQVSQGTLTDINGGVVSTKTVAYESDFIELLQNRENLLTIQHIQTDNFKFHVNSVILLQNSTFMSTDMFDLHYYYYSSQFKLTFKNSVLPQYLLNEIENTIIEDLTINEFSNKVATQKFDYHSPKVVTAKPPYDNSIGKPVVWPANPKCLNTSVIKGFIPIAHSQRFQCSMKNMFQLCPCFYTSVYVSIRDAPINRPLTCQYTCAK